MCLLDKGIFSLCRFVTEVKLYFSFKKSKIFMSLPRIGRGRLFLCTQNNN